MQLRARLHFRLGSRALKRGELCDVTERHGAMLVAMGWAEAVPAQVEPTPTPATLPEETPAPARAPRKESTPAAPVHAPRADRTAACKHCGKPYLAHPKRRGPVPADGCGDMRSGFRAK